MIIQLSPLIIQILQEMGKSSKYGGKMVEHGKPVVKTSAQRKAEKLRLEGFEMNKLVQRDMAKKRLLKEEKELKKQKEEEEESKKNAAKMPNVETVWVCVCKNYSSGMESSIQKFVEENEFEQAYEFIEPLVNELSLNSYGEWPVIHLEEAKEKFHKIIGNNILKPNTLKKCMENIQREHYAISKRLFKEKANALKNHRYKEWLNYTKTHRREAAKLLEKLYFVSISCAVTSYNRDMCVDQPWIYVFQTEEEKETFESYVREQLKDLDGQLDFKISDDDNGKVFLFEDIQEIFSNSAKTRP